MIPLESCGFDQRHRAPVHDDSNTIRPQHPARFPHHTSREGLGRFAFSDCLREDAAR